MPKTINISTSTIIRAILILIGLFVAYLVRDIILMLFLSIIIASAVDYPIDYLEKRGINRVFGVFFIYILITLFTLAILYSIIPTVIGQVKILLANLPSYLDSTFYFFHSPIQLQDILQSVIKKLGQTETLSNVFFFTKNIYQFLSLIAAGLVLSIYINLQESAIKNFLIALIPAEKQPKIISLIEKSQNQIGSWLRGELILMFCIGFFTYLGLSILQIKYALSLAVLAGLLEIIPYLGPILSSIPAMIIAFIQSPISFILVVGLYIILQELENHVLVPQIMRKSVGLNPVLIILVILVGGKLGGIMGAIISIPLTAIGKIILEESKELVKG